MESYHFDEARIKVKWAQGWMEGKYCPNKVAGCAPVAMAQLLSYFEAPTYLPLTYPERDQNSVLLDWNDIKKHEVSQRSATIDPSHYGYCGASEADHDNLGRMIRQLGQLSQSNYIKGETIEKSYTSTYFDNYTQVLKNLLPGKSQKLINRVDSYELFNVLSYGGVAIVRGDDFDEATQTISSHAWVASATAEHVIDVVHTYNYNPKTGEFSNRTTEHLVSQHFIHFNWGLGGVCDGYFSAGVYDMFKPGNPTIKSRSMGNDGSDFKYNVKAYWFK